MELAPVSPRGSPRRELTRRGRGRCAVPVAEGEFEVGSGFNGGNASKPDDLDDIVATERSAHDTENNKLM